MQAREAGLQGCFWFPLPPAGQVGLRPRPHLPPTPRAGSGPAPGATAPPWLYFGLPAGPALLRLWPGLGARHLLGDPGRLRLLPGESTGIRLRPRRGAAPCPTLQDPHQVPAGLGALPALRSPLPAPTDQGLPEPCAGAAPFRRHLFPEALPGHLIFLQLPRDTVSSSVPAWHAPVCPAKAPGPAGQGYSPLCVPGTWRAPSTRSEHIRVKRQTRRHSGWRPRPRSRLPRPRSLRRPTQLPARAQRGEDTWPRSHCTKAPGLLSDLIEDASPLTPSPLTF